MSFQQFLTILRARSHLALLVLLLVVAGTVAASVLLPKRYTAVASVVVDVRSPDPVSSDKATLVTSPQPSYMPTQIDIAGSERVALRVVKMLNLEQDAELREKWQDSTDGQGDFSSWIAQTLLKKLKVGLGKDSDVINIAYTAPDAAFASKVANAFARAYIDTNIELRTSPAKQSAAWFQEQGKLLREQMEQAQSRISKYQQAHGIVATDEKLDAETAKLNELSSQLTMAQAAGAEARSKQRAASSPDTMAEVMQNPLIMSLKADVARQEGKLKDASGNLGPNHPQYQRMVAENEALKARLNSEIRKMAESFTSTSNISADKEGQLRANIVEQKAKLLEMRRQRDELAVLMRDGEAAQKAYDQIAQKLTQSSLEGQVTQSNVAVLTPAVQPLRPSSPLLLLNTVIALFAGGLLGIAAAFVQEMRDRRVRSPADLEYMLDLPVLAEVRRPSRYLTVRRPALGVS
jgi:chain length determinant protein EpsF